MVTVVEQESSPKPNAAAAVKVAAAETAKEASPASTGRDLFSFYVFVFVF